VNSVRTRSGALVIAGLFAVCVPLWLLRSAIDTEPAAPAVASAPAAEVVAAALPARPAPPPTVQPAMPELPPETEIPDLRGHDTVDLCTEGFEPAIPAGFDTVSAGGATVAWQPGPLATQGPYDAPVSPIAIAHLVSGLLTEAAALTGTPRRERITVVVYPSKPAFLAGTHAPSWSGGIYDGGAVRVVAQPAAELGVAVRTLRHELLHAQLHTAVGCVPAWLNEGLAMYSSGPPPLARWLRMLRSPDAYDLGELAVPSFAVLPTERAERAYAESLAMIVFLIERSGEAGLLSALAALRASPSAAARAALWDRLYPGTGHRQLLDALARKLFGAPLGAELDAALRGAVCCHGLETVATLACRGVPPRPDRTTWLDRSSSPRALCDTTW
jgi:hypothetical protein